MKKIVLIMVCFLLCGCYDYKELNDIAIVSSVGVGYDEEYKVSVELIDSQKEGNSGSSTTKSVVVTGKGKSFIEAFNEALELIDKDPYFYQMQLLILDENIDGNGIKEIFDYLLRESKISNSFYTVLSKDITPEDLLNLKNEEEPIISTKILKLIENGKSVRSLDYHDEFDFLVGRLLEKGIDINLLAVEVNEGEISANHIGIFAQENFKSFLSYEHSVTLGLLNGKSKSNYIEIAGNGINLDDCQTSYEYKNGKMLINFAANGTIKKLAKNDNLRDEDIYKYLSDLMTKKIKNDINNLISTIREYNSDILGLGNVIYKNNLKDYQDDIGNIVDYEINVDVKVNKNGLTFEVIQ